MPPRGPKHAAARSRSKNPPTLPTCRAAPVWFMVRGTGGRWWNLNKCTQELTRAFPQIGQPRWIGVSRTSPPARSSPACQFGCSDSPLRPAEHSRYHHATRGRGPSGRIGAYKARDAPAASRASDTRQWVGVQEKNLSAQASSVLTAATVALEVDPSRGSVQLGTSPRLEWPSSRCLEKRMNVRVTTANGCFTTSRSSGFSTRPACDRMIVRQARRLGPDWKGVRPHLSSAF